MGRQDDTSWCLWVFRRNYIRESFLAVGRRVSELVFFNMPVQAAQSPDYMVSDDGVVLRARWQSAARRIVVNVRRQRLLEENSRGLGIRIL